LIGVAVLVGFNPVPLTLASVVAVGLVLLATFSYGIAAVFAKRNNKNIPSAAFATGQEVGATVLMTPFALIGLATQARTPALPVIGAAIGVGLFCTALAYLLYFRLIANIGPTRALTVTFLIPVFGILWGALFLGEAITANMIAGFLLIVAGMALVLGLITTRQPMASS
jgi:drug/metabolite transporter (DMT)-like permease